MLIERLMAEADERGFSERQRTLYIVGYLRPDETPPDGYTDAEMEAICAGQRARSAPPRTPSEAP